MITIDSVRTGVHSAARELLERGTKTTRALFTDDRVWLAVGAGWCKDQECYWADVWLEEVAEPEQRPVTGDTLWRLKGEGDD